MAVWLGCVHDRGKISHQAAVAEMSVNPVVAPDAEGIVRHRAISMCSIVLHISVRGSHVTKRGLCVPRVIYDSTGAFCALTEERCAWCAYVHKRMCTENVHK